MEEYKSILRSLLERQEWFQLFCSDSHNAVCKELVFVGLIFRFERNEDGTRNVTFVPHTPFSYPEDEAIAMWHLQVIRDIISNK